MRWKILISVFIHICFLFVYYGKSAAVPTGGLPIPTKDLLMNGSEYEYRLVNWCIVGQGEHLLYRWPFNQLKHFLLQGKLGFRNFEQNSPQALEQSKAQKPGSITLEFNKINCQKTKNYIGDGAGNYYYRAHVVIKSDVPFQGLVIQGNHAPFGVGFPFGQFDVDSEFECSDCQFGFGRSIPCISRPDLSLMHPTVGVFHYLYTQPWTRYPVGQQSEVHFNFKWAHTECSSARIVEFWVLMVLDFDQVVWIVEKFGPYEFQPHKKKQDAINPNDDYKTRVPQPFLPSPILPRCMPLPIIEAEYLPKIEPPTTTPTTTTTAAQVRRRRQAAMDPIEELNDFDSETEEEILGVLGLDKFPSGPRYKRQINNQSNQTNETSTTTTEMYEDLIEDRVPDECFRAYGTKYNATMCYLWKERRRQIFMVSTEAPTEDAIPGKTIRTRLKSQIKCEGQGPYFEDDFNKQGVWSPIRLAKTFDTDCITYYNRNKGSPGGKEFNAPYKVCKTWQAKFVCQDSADWALNAPWPANTANQKRYFPLSRCIPCPTLKPTNAPEIHNDSLIIRREEHGSLMITAYLLCFPISLFIARFYKETLHTRDVKGYRAWLCVHVVLSFFGLILIYVGYCAGRPSQGELRLHNILGFASVGCYILGMFSGWIRNKGNFFLRFSLFVHTIVGYAGWGLGLASLAVAPVILNKIHKMYYQIVVGVSGGFSILAFIILTINICFHDRRMEMRPRRSHFPIVEIRFDNVYPLGQLSRKIYLGVYIIITFAIYCAMLTVPWAPEE